MQSSDNQFSKSSSRSTEHLRKPYLEDDHVITGNLQQKLRNEGVNNQWDYEEILDILGFGKTQWIILLISGLLTMTSVAAAVLMGIIGISSQCEFHITQTEKGIMMAACVTGVVLSTYIWGCLSDIWGRRPVLIWSMFMANFLQFITIFVTNIWLFNIINVCVGLCLGAILGTIYPYLGEFNTAKYRAIVINYSTMFVSLTVIYVPAISWLLLSYDWSLTITESFTFRPWRLIILFSLLPGLIGALALLPFPESPKLLLAHDKHQEALKALHWISKFNTGQNLEVKLKTSTIYLKTEDLADADVYSIASIFKFLANIWKSTVPMFYKPHGTNVILAVMVVLGSMFSSTGLQVWFPEIVNRLAGGSVKGNSVTLCEILNESFSRERINATNGEDVLNMVCDDSISTETYINNMISGLTFLIGFFIQGLILRPLGRKNVLIANLVVGGLCGILINFVTNTTFTLILLCLIILLPGLAVSIMCGAMVDLVPTHFRGKVVSLGFTLGRIGTIVSTNLIAAMLEPYCTGIFAITTFVIFVSAGIVCYLPI